MRFRVFIVTLLFVGSVASADMLPPAVATGAISPNGQCVLRIRHGKVFRYTFDNASSTFVLAGQFKLRDPSPQFVYVSDEGDVICISLSESEAMELYSPKGLSKRKWDLSEFLSRDQIKCCPKTGATTQWIDEAKFYDREFVFYGPSQRIRRMVASYTLMRRGDPSAEFAFALDCHAAELTEVESFELGDGEASRTPTIGNSSYRSYEGQPAPCK